MCCPLTSVRLGSARPCFRLTLELSPLGVPRLRRAPGRPSPPGPAPECGTRTSDCAPQHAFPAHTPSSATGASLATGKTPGLPPSLHAARGISRRSRAVPETVSTIRLPPHAKASARPDAFALRVPPLQARNDRSAHLAKANPPSTTRRILGVRRESCLHARSVMLTVGDRSTAVAQMNRYGRRPAAGEDWRGWLWRPTCSAGMGAARRRRSRASGWPGRTDRTTAAGPGAARAAEAVRRVRAGR